MRFISGTVVWGRVLSLVGLIFCAPVGVLFVSVATETVGIFLGIVGYVLGLLVAQGVILGSYFRAVDGFFRGIGGRFGPL